MEIEDLEEVDLDLRKISSDKMNILTTYSFQQEETSFVLHFETRLLRGTTTTQIVVPPG